MARRPRRTRSSTKTLAAGLAAISDAADGRGVGLELGAPGYVGGPVSITWIERGRGGTSADVEVVMKELTAYCDARGLEIHLVALGGAEKLMAFYGRHGFECAAPGWTPEEEADGPFMRRPPGRSSNPCSAATMPEARDGGHNRDVNESLKPA